jgi:phenylalanyl-tRNA synthetase beta chain
MQLSEIWLREVAGYIDIDVSVLAEQLTMAGLEVEGVIPVAEQFSHVVVGHVLSKTQHPDADRLNVCSVDVGQGEILQIVCGAKNVEASQKVPVAKIGAVLPGNFEIKKAKLRGVESSGMICSPKELGFPEDFGGSASVGGIWVLDQNAPIGADFREYFQLNDRLISLGITPNRGDCLSLIGVARECAAANQKAFVFPEIKKVPDAIQDTVNIQIETPEACPHYVSRVIRGLDKSAKSPLWLIERLRRSGVKSIHPAVDVTNYVLHLFGQPMHAFDLSKIQGSLKVGFSSEHLLNAHDPHATIDLLDGSASKIQPKTLLISDDAGPVALAGVMGGLRTAVDAETVDIMFEAAHFIPSVIAGVSRRYGIHTDSAHRFERGVDPSLPLKIIDFATDLLISIAGGQPGPIVSKQLESFDSSLQQPKQIAVNLSKVKARLGLNVLAMPEVMALLTRIDLNPAQQDADNFVVTVPSYRFDLSIEEDITEEIARLYGLNRIEPILPSSRLVVDDLSETKISDQTIISFLANRGFMQAVNYTFIDPQWQSIFFPEAKSPILKNPIASDMSQMRGSLLPGLLNATSHNLNRQVNKVHFFELGRVFLDECHERDRLAFVKVGLKDQIHWSSPVNQSQVDFFDLKGDLEALFKFCDVQVEFLPLDQDLAYLHPGQSAKILFQGACVGFVGLLHPKLQKKMDFKLPVFVAELEWDFLTQTTLPVFKEISKYPSIRRDLAIVLDLNIPASDIIRACHEVLGKILVETSIFDIYMGKNMDPGKKSIALSLVLQEVSHTLVEDEINQAIEKVLAVLDHKFKAKLRE